MAASIAASSATRVEGGDTATKAVEGVSAASPSATGVVVASVDGL